LRGGPIAPVSRNREASIGSRARAVRRAGTIASRGPGEFVGGVVKLANDPEADLLESADSFLEAADRCLTSCKVVPGVTMLTVPGAVCSAFACELYLKFIHLKESGIPPRGHHLHELFTALSESVRQAMSQTCPDLEEVLARNASHFNVARYHHEVAHFSFRQQELLQLAGKLADWVHARYAQKHKVTDADA
jgi:HEPN domain-containing protein